MRLAKECRLEKCVGNDLLSKRIHDVSLLIIRLCRELRGRADTLLPAALLSDVEGGDTVGFGEGGEIEDVFYKTIDLDIME